MASEVAGWLDAARPLLPLQNPLWAFVHNNVLQAFEDVPFQEGAWRAAALYRARPYLSEEAYREAFAKGRVRKDVLRRVLGDVPLERFLSDPEACNDRPGYRLVPGPVSDHMVRYSVRDRPLMDLLVPVVAGYLNQGLAPWRNPFSARGLWAWFEVTVRGAPTFALDWQPHLLRRLERFHGDVDALEEALEERGEDRDLPEPVAAPSVGLGRAERWQEAYEQTFAGAR